MERSLSLYNEILLETPVETTGDVALTLKETQEEARRVLLKTIPVEAEVVVVGSCRREMKPAFETSSLNLMDCRFGLSLVGDSTYECLAKGCYCN